MATLKAQHLAKSYKGRQVVRDVSLSIDSGQIVGLLGPNGAGKTTTVECCEGLRTPDAGTVRVLGLDPVADAASLRPRVGVMLQDGGLPTGVGALEMLRHVASMYASPRPVDELVSRLGLATFARTTVRRLSGGQRQRLALAIAVVGRPEVVFLDEPSAGMDPQSRHAVWQLVDELRTDGVAVLLTTHLMDEAEELADDVVVVDHGRVIAAGTTRALVTAGVAGAGDRSPAPGRAPGAPDGVTADRTLRFDAEPGLPSDLVPGLDVREGPAGSYTAAGDVGPASLTALTAALEARGILASRITVGRRTLEDVFLDLTGRELR